MPTDDPDADIRAASRTGGTTVTRPGTAPVGRFTYELGTDRWTWSDELYAVHGFTPGEVLPTTAMIVTHLHPDDLAAVRALALEALESGHARGGQHRVVDAAGHERVVVLVVEPSDTPTGRRLQGLVLDVTLPHARTSADRASAMLAAATASRAVIDQAKGVLRLLHGVDDDAAFALLRWYSQRTNLRLRTLAERILDATAGGGMLTDDVRRHVDDVLHDGAVSPRPHEATGRGSRGTLTTDEVRLPGATFLRVAGEVDMLTAPDLSAALTAALAGIRAPAPLVVDLSEVPYVGRAGVAELLACHRRCRDAGTHLRVVVGPDGPALPADRDGLEIFDDLASAAA